MIKYRVEIVAIPETREEAMGLYDQLKEHGELLTVSSASIEHQDSWQVRFETDLGEDDRTIEQVQEFVDKIKHASEAVGSLEAE
ncbi:hypothetical protein [Glutamicibacter sp. FBE19]|uniref:hypothetical protein n=1 Tax=Glutamicibacter sp. FBE19 TaxID=2761534 RepID=UPI00189658E9|nr:hypothetical protein [Glutamicibacter sp. FBE19]MBF6672449.1 hypothetical protein [Glutamicibacter sp. FBE19]